jgi:O-antigen/teichoic acid export membrane protein
MRIKHSIKNIFISISSQVIIVLLGFLSRKVFLDSLGADYLGVNGLLTNVLSIMALVESGIGISIVYNLYKPLAEKDQNKIIALVQLYKKAYGILAIIVLVISIILYPFLGHLMKNGSSVSHLSIIYFLFVLKNMISYLNAHRISLINADQRGYVLARINLLFQIVTILGRIIILIETKNYILYLVIELLFYLLQNIINGRIVNNRYPYIKTKEKYKIDLETKENLVKNVKAMFLHNIGGYLVFGIDNILISAFISVATVGLYSNYTMITQQLSALVSPILGGIGASVGNLIATESKEKNYSVFKVSFLVNFWIYSFCVIFLFNLLQPFISWWLGEQYLLDNLTFIFILINFYLNGMRTAIATFKNKAGLFVQDKYAPLIEGLINLISSLILVKFFGLAGIFIGTTISTLSTVFWTQPCIVYKNVFMQSVATYFIKYGFYGILTIMTCYATTSVSNFLVVGHSFISLVTRGIICLIIPNLIYVVIFYRNEEFKYVKNVFNILISVKRQKKVATNNLNISNKMR